eukprot:TRINITY_DN69419_c0_g1_i1.p1 TRINITY_DN69419_c0_g1~~TRINITY_DN69419_c0_g1_i1.p1  ORF type:complete len:349 (+),score=50.46 TRINITY_DN69419_c0_g1_i1:100-1146(+)
MSARVADASRPVSVDDALELETLDVNLFRSRRLWKPLPESRAVFGGQIIGQSLVAACKTVNDESLRVHSLHSYFIRPGDNTIPAVYFVQQLRDGKSFSTRHVVAQQRGAVIFEALISFHRQEASPIEYQDTAPRVPPPDELLSRREFFTKVKERHESKMSERVRNLIETRINAPMLLDIRQCDPTVDLHLFRDRRKPREPKLQFWIRTPDRLSDQWAVHASVAAYASDTYMVSTSAMAFPTPFTMAASLDHSMWFHAPFRADEWMLFDLVSSRATSNRAHISGRIFREDGTLVITVAQEGLVRNDTPPSIERPPAVQIRTTAADKNDVEAGSDDDCASGKRPHPSSKL